jgi:lysophospholipase L1-like esterase
VASATTGDDTTAPDTPTNLAAAVVSSTEINLSWVASTDNGGGLVAGYRIYRNGNPIPIATVTGTSYANTGLTATTLYSYSVTAIDNAVPANESASVATSATTASDTSAPNMPSNLTATAAGSTQINLNWNASTDNGGGVVAGYRIYRNGNPTPIATVISTNYSDTGLSPATLYHYAVSAIDNAVPANESAAAATTLSISLIYNFNSGSTSGWTIINDSGIPSTWQVISGEYHQGADVGDSGIGNVYTGGSYHLGAYAYLPALTGLSDYRVSVDITPLTDPPPADLVEGKDVGLMFRYQNNSNYYRVSFNARNSYTRLEKKVGGTFITLATNARGYIDGQPFTVEVNLSGNLIQVTLDGDPLFAVNDPSIANGSIGLYSQDAVKFDNVVIDTNTLDPTLVLARPLAHSVQTGNAVTASAVVTNLPAGGSVEFEFGGLPCAAASQPSPGFYTASCGSPAQGDYFFPGQGLRGVVRDNASAVVASDENTRVGIAGNYYVSIGDSITAGKYDFFRADNQSTDGRVIGQQGYQAPLSDRLTASTGYPNIVFNEGVGGDETTDALTRVNSILERHPGANRMLVMLGTNDSGGGTPLSQAAYQANMQNLVNTLTAQSKLVWVAKLPPVLPYAANTTRNGDIQGYNTAIDSLAGVQPGGPNFFTFFYDNNGTAGTTSDDYERSSIYYNNLHPNSLGLHIMGELWNNTINSLSTVPFYLDRLCNRLVSATCTAVSPTNHKQNLLQVGNQHYIDETYTLTSIPAALSSGIWVQTANLDKSNNSASYIQFTVDRPVTVYVAYDAGALVPPNSLPDWLNPLTSSYVDTGMEIQTTNPSAPALHVYARNVAGGAVDLGGNLATGASGADANYLVIVVEQ